MSLHCRPQPRTAIASLLWNGQEPLGGHAKQIAAARDELGRINIFYVGTNDKIYQNFQSQPNGVLWIGEQEFSRDKAKQVLLVQDEFDRLNLFYIGTNNHLYQNVQINAAENIWSGDVEWSETAKQAFVILDQSGSLHVAFVDTHGALFRKLQDDPSTNHWLAAVAFGDTGVKQVCLALGLRDGLHAIYIGDKSAILRRSQIDAVNDTWSAATAFSEASARQVSSLADDAGNLHIFYAGTDGHLYHDWQIDAANDAWQGKTAFGKDKGKQIVAGATPLFGLETFFVGSNDGLYHNFEVSFTNLPNNANWNGSGRMPADFDKSASAQQVAVAQNEDNRLEIIYVGTNSDIYHDWEIVPPNDFSSSFNQILGNNCATLQGVSVTISVDEDIVADYESGPDQGFSFQLNAYSVSGSKCVWQQYVIGLHGKELGGSINNWFNVKHYVVDDNFSLISMPEAKIPAGYNLTISLANDAIGNVSGATLVVVDNAGNEVVNVTKTLRHLGVSEADMAPIIGFELNLVGPYNGQQVILLSGSGTFTYSAATPLIPGGAVPPCGAAQIWTGERSNTLYSTMPAKGALSLTQSFTITPTEPL